jgi:UDP-2-acetamido-2-deoxy-ribo-hexuluronate aminotransferase
MTPSKNIQMVDLQTQYERLRPQIDPALQAILSSAQFINGPAVSAFREHLEKYLNVKHVIPCANGTDALQIAMMALEFKAGDEIIVPSFTYVATLEVIALLGLTPVPVDVDKATFNITADIVKAAITPRTKAIVPVHLFGQSVDMEAIMALAKAHNLYIIEDNAQAIGADYTFADGTKAKTGTIGHIGCTSFFPSKNLGCYGDGGAIMTNDDDLAVKLRSIANHGQSKTRYYHDSIGVNSRLDSLQAAILDVKLAHLDDFNHRRNVVADTYNKAFNAAISQHVITPSVHPQTNHVYHQYTLVLQNPAHREALQKHLSEKGIPSMIYYPVPVYKQLAYSHYVPAGFELPVTEYLCERVFSLPIHTEMAPETAQYICEQVIAFFNA